MATPKVKSYSIRLVPFTGGLCALWAFFGPESYGTWLGTIVHAFRVAAGL